MADRWAELERKKAKLAQIRAEKEQRRIRERKVEKDGEILTYRGDGEEVVAMSLGGLTIRSLSLRQPEDSKTSKLPRTISRSTQTSPLPQRPQETQTDGSSASIETESWETGSHNRSCNPTYYSFTFHEDFEGL